MHALFPLLVSDSQKRGTPYTDNTHYSDGGGFHRTVSNDGPVKHTGSAQPGQQRQDKLNCFHNRIIKSECLYPHRSTISK